MVGIINLKRFNIPVEIRVVLHSKTVEGLPAIAEFIQKKLTMVNHVAFMGLEKMGFGSTNWNYLFVNPRDYGPLLAKAINILRPTRIPLSVCNIPLCMVPMEIRPFARRSISDWKNDYPSGCDPCSTEVGVFRILQ